MSTGGEHKQADRSLQLENGNTVFTGRQRSANGECAKDLSLASFSDLEQRVLFSLKGA